MKRWMLWIAGLTAGALLVRGETSMEDTYPLGLDGDMAHWLVLGYLPIPKDAEAMQANFNTDLLAETGGEARIRPVAGQTVTLQGTTYTWKRVRSRIPTMVKYGTWRPWVQLFHGENGEPLEFTAAYLYTQVVCPTAVQCLLRCCHDDAAKLFVNGVCLFSDSVGGPMVQDDEDIALSLRQGTNDFVFRIENGAIYGGLQARLVDTNGLPLRDVTLRLSRSDADAPELAPRDSIRWQDVISVIPPLPPAEYEAAFGARISRTMALLESGRVTHRPVRILFYGQSIDEQEWTTLLVNRLRERYPDTPIVAENYAIGGWGVPTLLKRFKHDILRLQPDLVEFHAYGGNESTWDRVLSGIRRETTADIIIRTAHAVNFDAADMPRITAMYDSEVLLLRGLAERYGAELIEVRREWLGYLATHKMAAASLLRDGIHFNYLGNALMVQLYERHFRLNPMSQGGSTDRVRHYEAVRPLEDRKTDGIAVTGKEWKSTDRWLESASSDDAMTLTFVGNRVDAVIAPCQGSARVLIDGKPPSAWNLFHGTGPIGAKRGVELPGHLIRYFEGPGMLEESWELSFKDVSEDGRFFRFAVTGSITGPDGEGDCRHEFVSTSGRITIAPDDWILGGAYAPDPAKPAPHLKWRILPDFRDIVQGTPGAPQEGMVPLVSYSHVTVADGLPFGRHTITLVPVGDAPVCIQALEVHRPPLIE